MTHSFGHIYTRPGLGVLIIGCIVVSTYLSRHLSLVSIDTLDSLAELVLFLSYVMVLDSRLCCKNNALEGGRVLNSVLISPGKPCS